MGVAGFAQNALRLQPALDKGGRLLVYVRTKAQAQVEKLSRARFGKVLSCGVDGNCF